MWHDWGSWLKLGIPGLAMIALKWWFFELCLILVGESTSLQVYLVLLNRVFTIHSLFSGTVGVTELAAQTLLINLNQMMYNLVSYFIRHPLLLIVNSITVSLISLRSYSIYVTLLFILPFILAIRGSRHGLQYYCWSKSRSRKTSGTTSCYSCRPNHDE